MSIYIYAETAFHHEGDKEYLMKLIDAAKESKMDGIKFQVLIELDEFMSSFHSAYHEAKRWLLTFEEWKEVFSYTEKLGLDIILMPLDIKAFNLIDDFAIKYLEIHSVSFKDTKLLKELDKNTIPIIFGIGGRTKKEIDDIIKKYRSRNIVLMSGFQSYPSNIEDIKLIRIKELFNQYPKCLIGYADHSAYNDEMAIISNEYAYLLGARIFEKHITIDEGIERIDFQSAVDITKLKKIKDRLIYLDKLLDIEKKSIFNMTTKEVIYRNRQKVPVAKNTIQCGSEISHEMIKLKMIDINECINDIDSIIAKKAKKEILKDQVFYEKDLT